MMNNQDFNFSEEIKPLEEIKQSKNNNEQPKGLIPRREGTLFVTENEIKYYFLEHNIESGMGTEDDIINITLTSISGLKVVIPAPGNISLKDLFLIFAHKFRIPEDAIGIKIIFLFNAEKLDTKTTNPIKTLIKNSNANITVIEQQNFNGA